MGTCLGKGSKLPATMLAVEAPKAGPVSLMSVGRRPVPRATRPAGSPDVPYVVLKVHYAALNPIDWKMMELGFLIEKWPYAFGCDVSGEVVETPEGSEFQLRDKVFAFTLLGDPVQGGAFAEYVRVPEAMLGRVPPFVSMKAASTVGLSSLTAAMGIYRGLQLPMQAPCPGKVSVLVYGASSSTGVFASCLLTISGYRVVAVASQKHHAWLKDVVGASQVVDYTDKDWMQQVAADGANAGLKFAVDCIAHVEKGDWTTAIAKADRSKLTGTLLLCDQVPRRCGAADSAIIATVDPCAKGNNRRAVAPISTFLKTSEEINGAHKYVKHAEKLLSEGRLITMPTQVVGGLEAVPRGLQNLKDGVDRRTKLVVKVQGY